MPGEHRIVDHGLKLMAKTVDEYHRHRQASCVPSVPSDKHARRYYKSATPADGIIGPEPRGTQDLEHLASYVDTMPVRSRRAPARHGNARNALASGARPGVHTA